MPVIVRFYFLERRVCSMAKTAAFIASLIYLCLAGGRRLPNTRTPSCRLTRGKVLLHV